MKPVGQRISKFLDSKAGYDILGPEGTWQAGGCYLLAHALAPHLPGSKMVGVSSSKSPLEHVATKMGEHYIDADGAQTEPEFMAKLQQREHIPNPKIIPELTPEHHQFAQKEFVFSPQQSQTLTAALAPHVGSLLGKSERTRVVSVIAIKDGRVLFGLRRDTGKWNLPGGHVEGDEDLDVAARRELKEETGLEPDERSLTRIGFCDVKSTLRVYSYLCHVKGKPDASEDPDEEMAFFMWLAPDQLPESVKENLHNKQDVSLQFIGAQERTLDLIWDEDAPKRRELEAELKKMAIKDIKRGKKLPPDMTLWPEDRHPEYDYSHVLPEAYAKKGFKLKVKAPKGSAPRAIIFDRKGMGVGELTSEIDDLYNPENSLRIKEAHLQEAHRGQGLGSALYEAMFVHALKNMKRPNVIGGIHSTLASKVHQRLAEKHGLDYKPEPNTIPRSLIPGLAPKQTVGEYDNRYAPYEYTIKSEEQLEKGVNQRLFPFNPAEVPDETKDQARRWQSAGKDRKLVPQLPDNGHERALLRLHGKTTVRRNPMSGEREFLLHRGVGAREASRAGSHIAYHTLTSWTPLHDMADFLGEKFNRGSEPHEVLSAWVPESKIHTVIPQFGETRTGPWHENVPGKWESIWHDNRPPGPNDMANEHEIIVKPHRFELVPNTDIAKASAYGWKPAFLNKLTNQLVVTPVFHNTDLLPEGEFTDDWVDGFVNPEGKFHTREETRQQTQAADSYQLPDQQNRDLVAELAPAAPPEDDLTKGAKTWKSKDGVSIPAAGTPERADWDKRYHAALVQSFANGDPNRLRPITIPTEGASGFNMPVNKDRLSLYRRMARAGEPLPPVVVRAAGNGQFHLIDGNHRQEAARNTGVPQLAAYEIVPLQPPANPEPKKAKRVRKDEEEIESWLAKAVRSSDFKAIGKATTREGVRFVDHKLQFNAHPPEHNPVVEHYQREVINGPRRYEKKSQGGGVTKKLVYETSETPASSQTDLFKPSVAEGMNARFMVKPYHEGIVRQLSTYQQFPIQGWAEMANQALYHAAGIGHLHQKVHVAEHDMGPGLEKEPALVVQMAHGFEPVNRHRVYSDNAKQHARLIGLMDFLTNNLDRHHMNVMASKDRNDLLAIDHGRSFNYVNNHQYKWTNRAQLVSKVREMHDQFSPYIASLTGWGGVHAVDPYDTMPSENYRRLENYQPIFDWWGGVSQQVRDAMQQQLGAIKDQPTRDHIWRNFNERAKWLDERAKFGLENYGMDWHRDPVVQYHPDQRSEEEIQAEEDAKARAEWEREQAEAK